MNKGMFGYLLIFIALAAAVMYLGNQDQITPQVAQAEAEMSIGVRPVMAIERGIKYMLTLVVGAFVTGVCVFAFSEAKKFYRSWQRDSQLKRWAPGPNAQYKQTTPAVPRLKREDIMLMALMNGGNMRQPPRINSQLSTARPASTDDDGFDLEF